MTPPCRLVPDWYHGDPKADAADPVARRLRISVGRLAASRGAGAVSAPVDLESTRGGSDGIRAWPLGILFFFPSTAPISSPIAAQMIYLSAVRAAGNVTLLPSLFGVLRLDRTQRPVKRTLTIMDRDRRPQHP
jgi:hypothetical protein